jgi:cyclic pyranopterin monophosphate synthase
VIKLSHVDDEGRASMVDVSEKAATERVAMAESVIRMSAEAFQLVTAGEIKKGDVLATARIAGIMAAKKTSQLIPLCHPLALTHVEVAFASMPQENAFRILASAKTTGQTGVEMEALTAASVAALTVYDMIKAVDRSARIDSLRMLSKSGGKSGTYEAEAVAEPPPAPPKPIGRVKAAARELVHDAATPRVSAANASSERDSLRRFMLDRRLRASEWAKSAAVPVNELYGFLSGRSRALSEPSAMKLAKAARATVAEMFGRKGAQ